MPFVKRRLGGRVGITHRTVKFSEAASSPPLPEILAAMTRLSGLPVTVHRSSSDHLYRLNAEVSFSCVPRERVTIISYVPASERATRSHLRDTPGVEDLAKKNAHVARMLADLEGIDDTKGTAVHVSGYVGEEGTLHGVASLALESLGGTLDRAMPDEQRKQCSMRLTPALLRQRHRQHRRKWMAALLRVPGYATGALVRALRKRATRR
jgi:hypothetical protein